LHATRLGERVSQLYIDPLSAHILLEGLAELKKRATKTEDELQTFAVIHLLTCTLEMLPLLRSKVMDTSSIEQRRLVQDFLVSEETFYEISVDDFDDTIKTTQCLYDWANELAEDEILEKYNVRPGELSGKLQKTDWLLYACEELARMSEKTAIIKIIKHVRTRLKHGVKAELLPLLAFKHIGRVRARKLFIHNIKTIADVERASIELLHGIVGEKIAKHLKEQVGQKNNNAAVEKQKYLS
jgi:helicase